MYQTMSDIRVIVLDTVIDVSIAMHESWVPSWESIQRVENRFHGERGDGTVVDMARQEDENIRVESMERVVRTFLSQSCTSHMDDNVSIHSGISGTSNIDDTVSLHVIASNIRAFEYNFDERRLATILMECEELPVREHSNITIVDRRTWVELCTVSTCTLLKKRCIDIHDIPPSKKQRVVQSEIAAI